MKDSKKKKLKKKTKPSEIIRKKIKKEKFIPSSQKIKFFSLLYKGVPAKRLVLIAFVVVAMLSIFIYGTKIRAEVSIVPILEIALIIFVIGVTVFYPERYSRQIGIIISIGASLVAFLEIIKGTFSIAVLLSILLLICGAGVYVLK